MKMHKMHRCLRLAANGVTALLLTWTSIPSLHAKDSASKLVRQGNQYHQQKDYEKAEEAYQQAKIQRPDACEIDFNLGLNAASQNSMDEAENYLKQSMQSTDATLEGKSKYNLGHLQIQRALQQGNGRLPDKDIEKMKTSLAHLENAARYFRDAASLLPGHEDAGINLEIASNLYLNLKEQIRKLEKQQTQPQNNRQERKPENNQQDPPPQEKQHNQEREDSQNASGDDDQNPASEPRPQEREDGSPPPQPEGPHALSEEEAERLLQMIREQEEENREQAKELLGQYRPVPRDW